MKKGTVFYLQGKRFMEFIQMGVEIHVRLCLFFTRNNSYGVCARACACVRVRAYVYVCVCVRACVRVCVCVLGELAMGRG